MTTTPTVLTRNTTSRLAQLALFALGFTTPVLANTMGCSVLLSAYKGTPPALEWGESIAETRTQITESAGKIHTYDTGCESRGLVKDPSPIQNFRAQITFRQDTVHLQNQVCLGSVFGQSVDISYQYRRAFTYSGIFSGYGLAKVMIMPDGHIRLLLGTPKHPFALQFPATAGTVIYNGYFMVGNTKESLFVPAAKSKEQLESIWLVIGTSLFTRGSGEALKVCTGYFRWNLCGL